MINVSTVGIAKVIPVDSKFNVIALGNGDVVAEQVFCEIPTEAAAIAATAQYFPSVVVTDIASFDAELATR